MVGPIALVVILLVVFPPILFFGGAALSAALGWLFVRDTDVTHPDSPYRDLNR
jgi:hypothetical protein